MTVDELLAEQRRYYAARAPEYDDWWFRRGRYALEPDAEARWLADIAEAQAALDAFEPRGDVLELAAGTGLWTARLAETARRVVAVDASEETLALNHARAGAGAEVEYVVADLFEWEPEGQFDLCFFAFWLSHVPSDRFDAFWSRVRGALRPGGRVFLVDSGGGDPRHTLVGVDGEVERRRLMDGREFRVVKRRWRAAELAERLAAIGWSLALRETSNAHFVYGGGT